MDVVEVMSLLKKMLCLHSGIMLSIEKKVFLHVFHICSLLSKICIYVHFYLKANFLDFTKKSGPDRQVSIKKFGQN